MPLDIDMGAEKRKCKMKRLLATGEARSFIGVPITKEQWEAAGSPADGLIDPRVYGPISGMGACETNNLKELSNASGFGARFTEANTPNPTQLTPAELEALKAKSAAANEPPKADTSLSTTYVILGVIAVAVIGAVVWFTRPKK